MPSYYLGKIGNKDSTFEIHACTAPGNSFRWLKQSQISDEGLFHELMKSRFKVLRDLRPIYCTAINPDIERGIEYSPHDYRDGVVHFVAVHQNQVLGGLSVAVDIDKRGVPLENKWESGRFERGADLDEFRQNYLVMKHGENRPIRAWEMGELYRHFVAKKFNGSFMARFGLYKGAYHLLRLEPRKRQLATTFIWVFDAIPAYFAMYRYVGAVLRNYTIEKGATLLSPGVKHIMSGGRCGGLIYDGKKISRDIEVPIPITTRERDGLAFNVEKVSFLDGVVDLLMLEKAIEANPILLGLPRIKGFNIWDRYKLRNALGIIGSECFDKCKNISLSYRIGRAINALNRKIILLRVCEFV